MRGAIAKVEPLTTARALRGPFDYRLPAELGEVGVGTLLEVPFGRRRLLGLVVATAERSELPAGRLAEPFAALGAATSPELVELGLWVARHYCSTPSRGLELVLPPGTGAAGTGVGAKRELRAAITGAGRRALAGGERLGPRQREALAALAEARDLPVAGRRAALRRLAERGLVTLREAEVARRPARVAVGSPAGTVRLTPAQERAVAAVEARLAAGGELLVHGVTGSGKTEVYLAAAEAALGAGRGVIVLVPEIGLVPQTATRFAARFGDRVAVLHSALAAGERRDEWQRLHRGEARICVGPRSAVFAPLADLGLIVLDEEHDPSYKQEGDPRYDAREVARRRAAASGAALVCGSATPRPETWQALERVELPERADGSALPSVEVLDMRSGDGRRGPLHERTREALAELARGGGKAIVMAPRRGFAPHVACRECGHAWRCPNCDVSLVLHRRSGLHCHHCGHREPQPGACTRCGSVSVGRHGSGTERLDELLAELVAPLPVHRLDSDTAAARGAHAAILSRFERAEAGILLGTQMVGKGHDFPGVGLSVILDADQSLRFPDFRAEERTFAQVAQLAGRSGRGGRGHVIVQTLAPDAEAIVHAAAHDAAGFLAGELERRRALGYPPFAALVRVEVTAPRAAPAQAAAAELAALAGPRLPGSARLLGPAPRFRLRGRERRQLVVKAPEPEREAAVAAVRAAVDELGARGGLRGVQLAVDVDPQ